MQEGKILIFGDSYSTFEGYIPQGFAPYYPSEQCGVTDVSQTWWFSYAQAMKSRVVMNNSWSGSTVCNTGYDGDCSQTSSFIRRLGVLVEDGFFSKNRIDKVIVFGGTNDSWTGNACGKLQFSGWTIEDLRLILPGYAYFIDKLSDIFPKEKIHVVINNELRKEVEKGIVEICKRYGVVYTLLSEIEKVAGHPTATGMAQIKNQILKDVKKANA